MHHPTNIHPVLCIDLKKNRIRIHKCTLHMLGNPEYIQLLVNPSSQMIAIRKSCREDHLAHHVKNCYTDFGYCYELYSRELLRTLCLISGQLKNDQSYRIYGNINHKEGIAHFSMEHCVPVKNTAKESHLL